MATLAAHDALGFTDSRSLVPSSQGSCISFGENDSILSQCPTPLTTPDLPEDYEIGDMLGSGSFGTVYSALNNQTGALFAIKELKFNPGPEFMQRVAALVKEITVLSRIRNRHIISYLGAKRAGPDTVQIFLQYVSGGSLQGYIDRFKALNPVVTRLYLRQLLVGLRELHAHDIAHRDIKPENILVDADGTLKLADFGCAQLLSEMVEDRPKVVGTPAFMSPEVVRRLPTDARAADIWALGCTVLTMVTGCRPWPDVERVETMLYHLRHGHAPPVPDTIDAVLADFLSKCLDPCVTSRANVDTLMDHPFILPPTPISKLLVARISPSQPASLTLSSTVPQGTKRSWLPVPSQGRSLFEDSNTEAEPRRVARRISNNSKSSLTSTLSPFSLQTLSPQYAPSQTSLGAQVFSLLAGPAHSSTTSVFLTNLATTLAPHVCAVTAKTKAFYMSLLGPPTCEPEEFSSSSLDLGVVSIHPSTWADLSRAAEGSRWTAARPAKDAPMPTPVLVPCWDAQQQHALAKRATQWSAAFASALARRRFVTRIAFTTPA